MSLDLASRFSRFDKVVIGVIGLMILSTAFVRLVDLDGQSGYRVAFMRATGANVANIWLIDPETGEEEQISFAPIGVRSFDVSADGAYIAYSARDFESNTVDIYRLDIDSGDLIRLTSCLEESSICDYPVWRADGMSIAYERSGMDGRDTRIWLLDLTQSPARNAPLLSDPTIGGSNVVWSDDGRYIGFYANLEDGQGILTYRLPDNPALEGELSFVPSGQGLVGEFAPDGSAMIFPEVEVNGPLVRSFLQIVFLDRASLQFQILTPSEADAFDRADDWHPEDDMLAITRRYLSGDNVTSGFQVYVMDMNSYEISPLIFDPEYDHGRTHWRPDGGMLLVQRTPVSTSSSGQSAERSELWLYDMNDDTLTQLTERAYLPQWVNGG